MFQQGKLALLHYLLSQLSSSSLVDKVVGQLFQTDILYQQGIHHMFPFLQ